MAAERISRRARATRMEVDDLRFGDPVRQADELEILAFRGDLARDRRDGRA